jgi:RNA polymerase sigma-70 factor (TIGR02957 family)
MNELDATQFDELSRRAFAIAYRMLGSVAEAEDVAQEALVRVHRSVEAGEVLESPTGFVATIATRLAIDTLRSARHRRETYVGDWLPEPIVTDAGDDPAMRAEMADSLSMAFLVLLERLSPEQRAALLLRDVFDYEYSRIAEVIGTSEANARQLAARARRQVQRERPRFETSREQRDELAQLFFAAARDGDLGRLEALLAHDAVLRGDGGGRVPAVARPVHGRTRVARTVKALTRQSVEAGATLEPHEVNGQPGGVVRDADGKLIGVLEFEVDAGQIRAINSIVNPDKLRHLGAVSDARTVTDARKLRQQREGSGDA